MAKRRRTDASVRRSATPRTLAGRFVAPIAERAREVRSEHRADVQALIALSLNSSTSLVAGLILGSLTGTLQEVPGLLLLIPAAIGLRGNVFTAFGNRLSTAAHLGTLRFTARPGSLLGQNVNASMLLTGVLSVAFAVLAVIVASALGVEPRAPLLDLVAVSVVGGMLASLVVLGASLALAVAANRFEWDLDNLVAPIVSTLGDVITLPALWVAAGLAGRGRVSASIGGVLVVAGVVAVAWALRSGQDVLRRVVRESLPVLLAAGLLSTLAGVVLESQLAALTALPVLLMVLPAFTSSAGALGGVLTSRTATNLHTGMVEPTALPTGRGRLDVGAVMVLAVPIYLFNGIGAALLGALLDRAGPSVAVLVATTLVAGLVATAFAAGVAWLGSIVAFRTQLDPDTVGVPVVTSSVDLVGAIVLVVALAVTGVL